MTKRKTGKNEKTKNAANKEDGLWKKFLAELDKEIEAKEAGISYKITKGEALIKSMVNEALKGDHRMMANVMKIIDKLDDLQTTKKEKKEDNTEGFQIALQDWQLMFNFFARHRPYIDLELDRRKKENPATFDKKWKEPIKLEDAPWYQWDKDKQRN